MHRLSAVLLIGAIAFAQPAAAPRTARVGGRVIRQTGEGVRRATVTLLGAKRYTGTTDANGVFAFDGVAPGTYALIAQRVGYSSQKYGAAGPLVRHCVGVDGSASRGLDPVERENAAAVFRPCIERAPGTMLSLTAGQEMKDLVISIAQHGVISGKVLNQDSEPIDGGVAAMKVSYERGVRRLEVVSWARIGPDGEYTVDDLPPGRYYLRATIVSWTFVPWGRQGVPGRRCGDLLSRRIGRIQGRAGGGKAGRGIERSGHPCAPGACVFGSRLRRFGGEYTRCADPEEVGCGVEQAKQSSRSMARLNSVMSNRART